MELWLVVPELTCIFPDSNLACKGVSNRDDEWAWKTGLGMDGEWLVCAMGESELEVGEWKKSESLRFMVFDSFFDPVIRRIVGQVRGSVSC